MSDTPYRLDRTAFKMQTAEQADNQRAYWLTRPVEERLRAAWYLISIAYRFDLDDPPRLDRTKFRIRKRPQ